MNAAEEASHATREQEFVNSAKNPVTGFRNIRPKTRDERASASDTNAMEKNRILNRSGYEAREHRANAFENSAALIAPDKNAAGYQNDADRFHTDTSGEEFHSRQQKVADKAAYYDRVREMRGQSEDARWAAIAGSQDAEASYWQQSREDGAKALKNKSCVPYDTMSLEYNKDIDGERLKYEDDKVKYRTQLRATNLERAGDTRTGYDIISGDDKASMKLPNEPQPSPQLEQYFTEQQGNPYARAPKHWTER